MAFRNVSPGAGAMFEMAAAPVNAFFEGQQNARRNALTDAELRRANMDMDEDAKWDAAVQSRDLQSMYAIDPDAAQTMEAFWQREKMSGLGDIPVRQKIDIAPLQKREDELWGDVREQRNKDRDYWLDVAQFSQSREQANQPEKAPSGYRWKPDGSLEVIPGGPESDANKKPDRGAQQTEISLATKFTSDSSTFNTVAGQYRRVLEVAKVPSAANDYALIYAFAKIQDPTSVVRESEFATAAQTGAYGEKVKAAVSKVANGQTLTASQRADFLTAAKNAYKAQERQWLNSVAGPYHQQAKSYGLNWKNIWRDYRVNEGASTASTQSYKHPSGATVEILPE